MKVLFSCNVAGGFNADFVHVQLGKRCILTEQPQQVGNQPGGSVVGDLEGYVFERTLCFFSGIGEGGMSGQEWGERMVEFALYYRVY